MKKGVPRVMSAIFGTLHFVTAVFPCQHPFLRRQEKFLEKIFKRMDQVSEKKRLGIQLRTTMRTCDIFYIYIYIYIYMCTLI